MRKNQNGYSPLVIICVILLVAIITVTGWLIYNRQSTDSERGQPVQKHEATSQETVQQEASPQQPEATDKMPVEDTGNYVFFVPGYSATFEYPNSFNLEKNIVDGITYVTLASPDHAWTGGDFGGTTQGTMIMFTAAGKHRVSTVAEYRNSIDSILNGNHVMPGTVTEQREFLIDGVRAVEFYHNHNAPPQLTTQIEHPNNYYGFWLKGMDNKGLNAQNIDIYRQIVSSFREN